MSTRFYDTDLTDAAWAWFTWLAAFVYLRARSLTDDLVDLLIETIHQIGARAERKVERELLDDLKRVTGKRQSNLDPFKLALVKTELEDRVDRRLFSRA